MVKKFLAKPTSKVYCLLLAGKLRAPFLLIATRNTLSFFTLYVYSASSI